MEEEIKNLFLDIDNFIDSFKEYVNSFDSIADDIEYLYNTDLENLMSSIKDIHENLSVNFNDCLLALDDFKKLIKEYKKQIKYLSNLKEF